MSAEKPTTGERLAVLETDADHIQGELAEIKKDVKSTKTDVEEIKRALSKQKGFIAGVMFVVVPLWAVFWEAVKTFWDRYLT